MTEIKADVVFLLHDAGGAMCLIPLIERLHARGVNCKTIALSFPALDLLYQTEGVFDIRELLGVDDFPFRSGVQPANEAIYQVAQSIEAKAVVGACMRPMGVRLLQALQHRGLYCIAYHDSFDYSHDQAVNDICHIPLRLWLPSDYIRDHIRDTSPLASLKVVGQPTLSTWREPVAESRKQALRRELCIDESKPLVVFVGGYGEHYQHSFELFIEVMRKKPEWHSVVLAHPGCGKQTEQRMLENAKVDNITVASGHYVLSEVATLASLVVSEESTANVQALFSGIPSIYLVKLAENYQHDELPTSYFVNHGFLHRCFDAETFFALSKLEMNKTHCITGLHQRAGIPERALDAMYDDLIHCLEALQLHASSWQLKE